jgi:hypothetical protein
MSREPCESLLPYLSTLADVEIRENENSKQDRQNGAG